MLSPEQMRLVEQLSAQLDTRQLTWLSGYLAGLQTSAATIVAPQETPSEVPRATIIYGSQTGNGKTVADGLAAAVRQRGLTADIVSMADYKTARLKKEKFLFAVISTHGEGDAPDSAMAFFEFLQSPRAPKLAALSYSVLALGDSSYEHFCRAGRDLDSQLRTLGATPLTELTECDLDFERDADRWRASVVESFSQAVAALSPTVTNSISATVPGVAADVNIYNRQNPFSATILTNIALSSPATRTRHVELSLEGAGISYRPGDSLGVCPQNSPQQVEQTAAAAGLSLADNIEIDDERGTVEEWLSTRLEIATLTPVVVSRYLELLGRTVDAAQIKSYIIGRDVCDLLQDYPPPSNSGARTLACLRRLAPRMYSISSSARAREDEAHLLVARSGYFDVAGRQRAGVCSSYLGDLQEGDTVKVFVQSNENFRLPDDERAALVMIGPGSGVAPFRAFMEEREERGGDGKNWLFFGERRRREDFYYQTEWQSKIKNGLLTRMDVAFSRDSAQKIYVQHKMRRRADELWEWLETGAYVYVCGDEKRMAKDVHAELSDIINKRGGDGEQYLAKMRAAGRYQRDVY